MTQLFNMVMDGVDVTSLENECTISEEMNRMYDTASFMFHADPKLEVDVVINYGDKTFNGFVYKTSKVGKNKFRVECRTEGAKLTEPYSPSAQVFDEATTSHELCALYASASGVPISITAGNLTFGGSYERRGTMLSALMNIADVTGAEYWDDGTGIQIQPNKAITVDGFEIPPSDIFDFVSSDKSVFNKGIGFITIMNGGSESNDIISKNNIYAEIDECSGEIFVYPNPYSEVDHTTGVSPLSPLKVDRVETTSMLDQDLIRLDAAIDSIDSITLNGSNISDYNFEQGHNVIYFNTLKRGILTIGYKALAYSGYTNVTQTPIGRFITFDIFYLDQIIKFEGFLISAGECVTSSTDGDMVCIVPADMYYNEGFTVWTIGGEPEFSFYNRNVVVDREVVSTSEDYTSVESATLEETVSGYRYKTKYLLDTARGARSDGVDVAYTTSVDDDGDYFEFTQYFPKVTVSYETPAMKHTVQFDKIDNASITMVLKNNDTDQVCEYDLDTKIPCILNQYYPVDVAAELSLEVTDVAGKTISYLTPEETSNSVTVDNFGTAKIWIFMDGDYVINTSLLKARTSITLVSQVNG